MMDVGNWTRLKSMKEAGLPDLVGVYASAADIAGSGFDPDSMGMRRSEDLRAEQQEKKGQPVELPKITSAALSINAPHEVRIVDHHDNELAGSRFPDTHEQWWTDRLANDGLALLLVGPVTPYEATTFKEFLSTTYVAVLPLALYQYDAGVGVTGPS